MVYIQYYCIFINWIIIIRSFILINNSNNNINDYILLTNILYILIINVYYYNIFSF